MIGFVDDNEKIKDNTSLILFKADVNLLGLQYQMGEACSSMASQNVLLASHGNVLLPQLEQFSLYCTS